MNPIMPNRKKLSPGKAKSKSPINAPNNPNQGSQDCCFQVNPLKAPSINIKKGTNNSFDINLSSDHCK
jgi:hypothetical protein